MAAGVPFPLLAAAQLLAVAAAFALCGATLLPGRRCLPVALGALLVAAADVVTAVRYGATGSDPLAAVRAAGQVALAAGLLTAVPFRAQPAPVVAVLAPVGAGLPVSLATALSGGVAALAALRAGIRSPRPVLLAGGLLLWAAAGGLGERALTSGADARLVLLLRGIGAVLVLASVVLLARVSLLGKVVGAILAGVLAMALAAVTVTGVVLTRAFADQQRAATTAVAGAQAAAIDDLEARASTFAGLVSRCAGQEATCEGLLSVLRRGGTTFALLLGRDGAATSVGAPLDPATITGVRGLAAVQQVLDGGGPLPVADLVALPGPRGTVVAVVGVAPGPQRVAGPASPPTSAGVFGIRLDAGFAADAVAGLPPGYGVTVLDDDGVVASTVADPAPVALTARRAVAQARSGGDAPATSDSDGSGPAVAVVPLTGGDGDRVGLLTVSLAAQEGLRPQRSALRLLFLTSVAVMLLVAGLAVVLARRLVDPVRRLTAAAGQIRRGDLDVSAGVRSVDEIGVLSRAFDGMTASLQRTTDDLRRSALQETALRTRLETVLAAMTDALVSTDARGRITTLNPAAAALLGVPDPARALGRPLGEVVVLRSGTGEPVVSGAGIRSERLLELVRPDGTSLPVQVATAELDDPAVAGRGRVLVLRDMTRERQVERMKTEFLSNVSHELRTPLTPIRGYAEILRKRPDLPTEQTALFAGTIVESAARMARVVDLLVDVAALEAGKVRPRARPTSVGEIVEQRLVDWRRRAPQRVADLDAVVAEGLPPVLVDPEWVAKALDELLDNAVKHTPPGSRIRLTADRREQCVRVAVRDDGPGIDPADAGAVLAAFAQVDGSATRAVGGLGLGLSFVRRLADTFGLPLTVDSVPGRGSVFALDLPVLPRPGSGRRTPVSRAAGPRLRAGSRAAPPSGEARGRAR